jgi:hypothetical protein
MLHVFLAALLAVPAPAPSPAPCKSAHRLFCGPIRILPRDGDARGAVIGNAIATLVDGVVTAKNTHGNPALEANPMVRPFVRGGLPGLLLSWTTIDIGQHALAREFHLADARVETAALGAHLSGIASWLSPRTYGWMPDEWDAYHQPYEEAAWIRFNATAGHY